MLFVSPSTARSIAPHASTHSWIMFVQVNLPSGELGPIWIESVDGSQIGKRLGELAKFNAFDAMLIGLVIATPSLIADLAQKFEPTRTHDSWYSPSIELLTFISQHGQEAVRDLLARVHPGGLSTETVGIDEIAKVLGVSVKTIRRMIDKNEIPHMRSGRVLRFVPAEVIASLRRR